MLTRYHIEIISLALFDRFSSRALDVIITANIRQDSLWGQFGHDEYHFDNNAFEKSYAYIEEQRRLTIDSLRSKDVSAAWRAFGRLLHSVQDFYAHSNYIDLWLACQPDGALPTVSEVDPLDPDLIHTPALRSGKIYFPLDALYFIRPLRRLVLRLLPRNSHGWMNLDSPEQGFKFDYAMQAAIKRTKFEFEKTIAGLSDEMCRMFFDK
ncbi:MAG TPA: HET-C-related protein [Anaerolineales bacterium]|nr:HET-C-related protein [Anaerolineales bacterium]